MLDHLLIIIKKSFNWLKIKKKKLNKCWLNVLPRRRINRLANKPTRAKTLGLTWLPGMLQEQIENCIEWGCMEPHEFVHTELEINKTRQVGNQIFLLLRFQSPHQRNYSNVHMGNVSVVFFNILFCVFKINLHENVEC